MKKSFCFLYLFLLICNPLFSEESDLKLIVESIGLKSQYIHRCAPSFISEIKRKHLGYIISLNNLPDDELTLVIERPLMVYGFAGCPPDQAVRKIPMTKEQLVIQQKDLAFPRPLVMTLSSAGYVPGERIEIRILDKYDNELSQVAFIPSPLRARFNGGKAKVSFECISLESSMYKISYSGFEKHEVVSVDSQSGFESIPTFPLEINENALTMFSNAVIGMNGGISQYTVTRKNGDKVTLKLPWGNKLIPYLRGELSHGNKI